MATKTIYEFDDICIAPLHGFKNAEDYYGRCSPYQFLSAITTPTLIIRSQDDPFFKNDIPYEIIDENPYIQSEFPQHGGHVGFAEGYPWRLTWWAQQQAVLFLKSYLSLP